MKGLIFTYLLTYGGSVAALFNPFVGLLIYVCFAIIKPDALWHWSVPAGNYSRIIAVSLLSGWALSGFGGWRTGAARPIVWSLLGFWGWLVISSMFANSPGTAFRHVESLSKVFLPFVVGITLLTTQGRILALAWVIVMCQGFLALELNLTYLQGGFNPHEFVFAGLDNNGTGIAMCSAIGLAFFLGLDAQAWWQKGLALVLALLMAHFVLFSMSRGSTLALALTIGAVFGLLRKSLRHYVVFAAAALLVVRLAGAEVQEKFFTIFADSDDRDQSAASRLENWQVCWTMMLENPLLGVGPQNYPLVVEDYVALAGKSTHGHLKEGRAAHSLWLQAGAETGFVGLGCLLAFYGVSIRRLWPLARERIVASDPAYAALARGVIASLIGFALSAQFVSLEGLELPYYVVLVGAATLNLAGEHAGSSDFACAEDVVESSVCDLEYHPA